MRDTLSNSAHLGGEVLEDGGKVNWRARPNTFSITAFLEETGDSANGELEAGFG